MRKFIFLKIMRIVVYLQCLLVCFSAGCVVCLFFVFGFFSLNYPVSWEVAGITRRCK